VTLLYRYADEGVCWILCNYSSTHRSINACEFIVCDFFRNAVLRKNVKIERMNELFLEVSRIFYSTILSMNSCDVNVSILFLCCLYHNLITKIVVLRQSVFYRNCYHLYYYVRENRVRSILVSNRIIGSKIVIDLALFTGCSALTLLVA